MNFCQRLRECRKKVGLTQEDFARELNIAYSTYRRYEQGGTEPSLSDAVKIADFFHVSLDYLTGRTDDPEVHR